MDINVRLNEGCAPQPQLFWDTIFDSTIGLGDWAVASPYEKLNIGGLQAMRPIDTAVILCLFTDKVCPPNHPLKPPDADLRGWWGDGIDVRADLGEAPLGSLLWLLERSILDRVATPRWAKAFALDALAPLLASAVVVEIEVEASVPSPSRLDLDIQIYGQNRQKIYGKKWADIWAREVSPLPAPAPIDTYSVLGSDGDTPLVGGSGPYILL